MAGKDTTKKSTEGKNVKKNADDELERIRIHAVEFSGRWDGPQREKSEAQTFINEFFAVFGLDRRTVASLEEHPGDAPSWMDGFWKGKLMIEMKSTGEDLDDAMEQALEYYVKLKKRDEPRWILACDFHEWLLLDKNTNARYEFALDELGEKIGLFGFMTGRPLDAGSAPVNIEAAEIMGKIYDQLKKDSPNTHPGYFLTRLVFCLFADNTGIFRNKKDLRKYIVEKTVEDGSDLGMHLREIFATLNKDIQSRSRGLNAELDAFPYINGALFSQEVETPYFNREMRDLLIEAAEYDWSKVSPAIFGGMFETVMDDDRRREMGAHYTAEENIMKVVRPLFLDELRAEFAGIMETRGDTLGARLGEFQDKLAGLKFLDPACGSGNFLLLAYRELRKLEQKCILEMRKIEPSTGGGG